MLKLQILMHRLLTKRSSFISITVGLTAFFTLIFAVGNIATAQSAQTKLTGEWTAGINSGQNADIELAFYYRTDKDGYNVNSSSVVFGELRGVTRETILSPKANVNFSLVREAGTLTCTGYFNQGNGAGFWTFTPEPGFASAMRGYGYNNLTDEDMLRAALRNLTVKYTENLKVAGYDHLEFEELVRAASHKITPDFIREMKSAGYTGLSMAELIRASNHDINAEYIKEARAMGFDKQSLDSLINLRNHEITPEFISNMKALGFNNLSIEELIRLKNSQITPEFINGLKAAGVTDISAETAIRLKNHEVDGDFIKRVKARGFSDLTPEQLIRLRSQNVIK